MQRPISIGDEAPNFDLSSTEDALLMLKDEIPRAAVVLYFFADPTNERVQRDLLSLAEHRLRLTRLSAKPLAVSPAAMPSLKQAQAELKLTFPLLHDDREFSQAYGVDAAEEGKQPAPALVVVSRRQRILWLANPVTSVADAMPQVEKLLRDQPSPSAGYPKKVINRLIDRWVN